MRPELLSWSYSLLEVGQCERSLVQFARKPKIIYLMGKLQDNERLEWCYCVGVLLAQLEQLGEVLDWLVVGTQ